MDPFSTLGLPARFGLDTKEIEARYRELHKALHPDRFAKASAAERRLSLNKAVEVNEAYRTLRDDLSRAKALLALHGQESSDSHPSDPEFLMEVMERRESLANARGDLERVHQMGAEIQALYRRSRERLASAFERASSSLSEDGSAGWNEVRDHLAKLRYYRRFLDEVEAIEDETL